MSVFHYLVSVSVCMCDWAELRDGLTTHDLRIIITQSNHRNDLCDVSLVQVLAEVLIHNDSTVCTRTLVMKSLK